MKSLYRITLTLLAAMAVMSCKEDIIEDAKDMMSFAPSDVMDTKSLISAGSFQTAGNEVSVIDYYRPQGAQNWYEYVNSTLVCSGASKEWSDDAGKSYYWTLSGTHKAFGWLKKDATSGIVSESFFGSGFSYDDRVLTVPERVITTAPENQYDFMYSLLSTRNLPGTAANDYSPIPLEMWHLFTAIGIGIKNATKVDVTIKSLTIQNLTNVKSAAIDFSDFAEGHEVDVEYAAAADAKTKDTGFNYTGGEFTLVPGASVKDVITSTTGGNNTYSYHLMWPQTVAELTPAHDFNVDDDGNYIENDTDPLIIIEYITNGTTVKRALRFAENTTLQAGYRYHFDIVFAEKQVELLTTVLPWNYTSTNINFDDAAVSVKAGGMLTPTAGSYTPGTGRKLYIKNGQGVNFTFTLDAPAGGTWRVSLERDREYFSVSPSTGTVNSQQASFTVTPVGGNAERDYTVTVKIVVIRPDGTTVNADILQKVDNNYSPYEIIWQKN